MRQWAIENTRGNLIKDTVSNTKESAWVQSRRNNDVLDCIGWSMYGRLIDPDEFVRRAEEKGYKCVRVITIKEVKVDEKADKAPKETAKRQSQEK